MGGAGDRPLPFGCRSALVEAARETLLAAFLVNERRLAPLLAQIADLLARGGRRRWAALRPWASARRCARPESATAGPARPGSSRGRSRSAGHRRCERAG